MKSLNFLRAIITFAALLILPTGILTLIPNAFAADAPPVPAFPGAEGFGAMTRGGRGGKVLLVTNLNDSGPGSLRDACETEGARIVVFTVSGTITLASALKISHPYITIAGQTAPGDGICIKRYPLSINASEVIIRYIRVRLGDEADIDADAISGRYHENIIIDHVSASWSVDETMSIYHCENVTVQWCLISESLYNAGHAKGVHGFGGIWGSNRSTYHHNLLAHHSSRNPRFASGCGYNDFRNNVVYNWGYNSAYGGENQKEDDERFNFTLVNIVANYFKPGPATRPGKVTHRIVEPYSRNSADGFGKWYVADNVVYGNETVTANNWDGGVQPQGGSSHIVGLKLDEPFDAIPISQQTAEEAYHAVLDNVGASLPKRDTVDARIVDETRNGDATYEGVTYENNRRVPDKSKKCGIIDSQTDVGGWPELKSLSASLDSDGDGLPDEWEIRYGLDSRDASNASKDRDSDGYTNIEEYLNGTDPTAFVDYTKPENNVNTLQHEWKIADIPVSPYGFGPYPELPAGWPADQIWPCISANHELMMRVEIKLAHQGIDVMGSIMENGLVYPMISDTIYVEWAKTARRQYIRNMAGDPDACDRIRAIEDERGVRFTEADIPSDIKVLSFSEGGIAPYEFLDLP